MHQMGSTVQITRATEQQQLEFISVIEIVMNIPLIKQGLNEDGFHGPKKPVDYNSKLSPCHRDLEISVFKPFYLSCDFSSLSQSFFYLQ